MSRPLLDISGLAKSFGALRATDGVDLLVEEGETHAIIGPNGAGKTTLIGQLAGNIRPDAGRIRFAGEDNIVVGSDYCHADHSSEPDFQEVLWSRAKAGEITSSAVSRMLYDNPKRLYGL